MGQKLNPRRSLVSGGRRESTNMVIRREHKNRSILLDQRHMKLHEQPLFWSALNSMDIE